MPRSAHLLAIVLGIIAAVACEGDVDGPSVVMDAGGGGDGSGPGDAAQVVADASPTDPDASSATRDPYFWPFAASSIWNMPIHHDAEYAAAGVDRLGYLYTDDDVIIMTPGAPLAEVYENFKDWSDQTAGVRCLQEGDLITSLPIPDDLVIPHEQGTPNMSAAVLLPDGRTIHQSQPFHRCTEGGYATSHYVFPEDDIISGDGIPGAHGGSAMSSLGGSIRLGELAPGSVIRHALKIGIHGSYLAYNDDGTRGYRWPAQAADSGAAGCYTNANAAMEMGVLLALKPDFDLDSLQTEPGKILARAFRDYGGYVTDIVNCGGPESWWGTVIMTEWGNFGRVRDEFEGTWGFEFNGHEDANLWTQDVETIFTSLWVVSNNSAGTIGGGPNSDVVNRRAPQAPPFAE